MSEDDDESDVGTSSSEVGKGGGGGSTSTLIRGSDSSVEVVISVPGTATKAAFDRACSEASKALTIPGFRKGARVPPAVIESAMTQRGGSKNALRVQAVNSLVKQLVERSIKEDHGLDPIGSPVLNPGAEELASDFVPGEVVELRVKCDVWPDIDWKKSSQERNGDAEKPYYGLKGSYERKPFNSERYEKALNDLVERYATTVPATDESKALEMGDACVIDMVGFMAEEDGKGKGEPLPNTASGDDVEVVLGEGRYMEGLVEGLVGAKVGDVRTIYTSFPEVRIYRQMRERDTDTKTAFAIVCSFVRLFVRLLPRPFPFLA